MISEIRIIAMKGIPEIVEGDDLASLICAAARTTRLRIADRDIFVVAQKVVSKAEGRVVSLDSIEPSPTAKEWAEAHDKDARMVEVVMGETKRVVRMERGVMICETRHGFVCANAGVDRSNAAEGTVILLPEDPDLSAHNIQVALERAFGVRLAVIVSDTFGRPWREGLVNVALGVAGMSPLIDYRGQLDSHGQELRVTVIAVADEVASAAELMMGKRSRTPVVIIRGFDWQARSASGRELIRPAEQDLFR
jgi:coenzyme F420-0:L-glutamate ligase / coenzyme F420-1:gamma-L-glutamate ligase